MSLTKNLIVLVVSVLWLIVTPRIISADLAPIECSRQNPPKYCYVGFEYKQYALHGPMDGTFLDNHPELAILINFVSIFLIFSVLSYFYLKYRSIKGFFLGTIVAVILGAVIDTLSLWLSYIINRSLLSTYKYEVSQLESIFYLSLFAISFILLGIMYFLLIRKLTRVDLVEKAVLSAIILAILTNPGLFLYVLNNLPIL